MPHAPQSRSIEATTRAALDRIEALDGTLRAFLMVDREGAIRQARILDAEGPMGRPLYGVPTAIKDLTDTAGLRTTYGSLAFADHVPTEDDTVVARLRAAGAVILGKTMTPEFGFGALCTNRLGGPTANPWDTKRTTGGSSGGAAAAVAAGIVPFAHGTDFGGSVRKPACLCGIASLRPTPGALPNAKRARAYDMLSTPGYLARDVGWLDRVFRASMGPDSRDPLSALRLPDEAAPDRPLRVAATADFGFAAVARDVRERFALALDRLRPVLGALDAAHPDCSDAEAIFFTLRPAIIRHDYGGLPSEALTETVRWWIDLGASITADAWLEAEARRTAYARRFVDLFERYDALVAPATSVMAWPLHQSEVTEIDGTPLRTRADFLAITYAVTLAGCPVVTLPVPQPKRGLPFGIQVIGPPGSDLRLLRIAARLEAEAGLRASAPPRFPWEAEI